MDDLINETNKVIDELQWFRSVLRKGGKIPEYYEAQVDILTKAIKLLEHKLLEQPEQQTDWDTISRQAAIAECNKRGAEHVGYAIAHLPPAQPEYLNVIIEKIRKNYEKAMNVSYINDPMATALGETWKEYVNEKEHKRG